MCFFLMLITEGIFLTLSHQLIIQCLLYLVNSVIIMSRRGISPEFLQDVSERVQKLQAFSDVCNGELLQDIEESVEILRADHLHNSKAGVPPPIDQEVSEYTSSYSSEVFDSDPFSVEDLEKQDVESIRTQNAKMKDEIEYSLRAFRTANENYMKIDEIDRPSLSYYGNKIELLTRCLSEVTEEKLKSKSIDAGNSETSHEIGMILTQIHSLQSDISNANIRVFDSETKIVSKEIENLELRHKIALLERSIRRPQDPKNKQCRCTAF